MNWAVLWNEFFGLLKYLSVINGSEKPWTFPKVDEKEQHLMRLQTQEKFIAVLFIDQRRAILLKYLKIYIKVLFDAKCLLVLPRNDTFSVISRNEMKFPSENKKTQGKAIKEEVKMYWNSFPKEPQCVRVFK